LGGEPDGENSGGVAGKIITGMAKERREKKGLGYLIRIQICMQAGIFVDCAAWRLSGLLELLRRSRHLFAFSVST